MKDPDKRTTSALSVHVRHKMARYLAVGTTGVCLFCPQMWCRNTESVAAGCNGCFRCTDAAASNVMNHDHWDTHKCRCLYSLCWREPSSRLCLVFWQKMRAVSSCISGLSLTL